MKIKVSIIETLERTILVEAKDETEALVKAEQLYRNSDIVLDADDYVDTEIELADPDASVSNEEVYDIED